MHRVEECDRGRARRKKKTFARKQKYKFSTYTARDRSPKTVSERKNCQTTQRKRWSKLDLHDVIRSKFKFQFNK